MTEKYVTIATFHRSFEAQLAKNLLEEEGIASTLSGEITADMLPFGQAGGSDQIVLQVRDDDAQRASGLLAEVAAARLEDNWEEEAESGAGVWICSICGEPISNLLSSCYSCQTPREGIRASAPRDPTAIQQERGTLPTGEEVQKLNDGFRTSALAPAPPLRPVVEDLESEETPPAAGDDLARRAFGASFFGILTVLLLPISWYYLTKLFFFPEELSPKGMRYVYGALFINGLFLLVVIVLWSSGVIWL